MGVSGQLSDGLMASSMASRVTAPVLSSAPLNILHTESSCGWGGQEIRVLSEAAGFIARGHRVTLAAPAHARIAQEAARFGVPLIEVPIEKKRLSGLLALRRVLAQLKPDVVNPHSSTDSWLTAMALRSLGKPAPLVRTRHISSPIPQNAATRWLYAKASARVVTTGLSLREQVIRETGIEAARVRSVPTGMDFQRYRPATLAERRAARAACGLPADAPIVGAVATLRSWKGHRYLLEAFASLKHPDAVLALVGDGPQADALRAQAATLGLGDKLVMPGNQTDVLPWLHALDVFAMPSYANEGIPQAMLQAMGCGHAPITTDAGAIPELAREGDTAWVVKREDSHTLAEAIADALAQPGKRARMGAAARAWVESRHGVAGMLDAMETTFREAVAEHRAR
jgi:glycosyltransferase involved in cell wall biosynthesis